MGYAIGYQNLELSISQSINGLVFKQPIKLYLWESQVVTLGVVTQVYAEPIDLMCSVQQENAQDILNIDGFNASKIYYRFYIQSNIVSGINRPEQHAQDYIIWKEQRYTICAIFDTFNTGWKYVVAVEDTGSVPNV